MAKLTREQKIEIYKQRLKEQTLPCYSILSNDKNRYYSKKYKEIAINRVLIKRESLKFVDVELGLSSVGALKNWIKKYKENCYNVIENKRGRKPKTMTKIKKSKKVLTKEEKIKD